MAMKVATDVANAMLDAFETIIGASPVLRFYSGAPPANCAAASSGTLIAEMTLDATWMDDAASAIKSFSDLPIEDLTANAAGIIGHYRLFASGGTVCKQQGTVTETGGGGDMIVDNNDVNLGQKVSVTAWSINLTNFV